mmetsp:Transcript_34824/g.68418  ORF Transcript_34824/g.68418 Transcript_34824/m.68418 type:complete len:228 (-) Transcript_34824:394-1077(-)
MDRQHLCHQPDVHRHSGPNAVAPPRNLFLIIFVLFQKDGEVTFGLVDKNVLLYGPVNPLLLFFSCLLQLLLPLLFRDNILLHASSLLRFHRRDGIRVRKRFIWVLLGPFFLFLLPSSAEASQRRAEGLGVFAWPWGSVMHARVHFSPPSRCEHLGAYYRRPTVNVKLGVLDVRFNFLGPSDSRCSPVYSLDGTSAIAIWHVIRTWSWRCGYPSCGLVLTSTGAAGER